MGQEGSKQVDSPDEWDIVAAPEEHFEHYLRGADATTKQHSFDGDVIVEVLDKRSSRDSAGPGDTGGGGGDGEKARGKPTPHGHHHRHHHGNHHHHHHRRQRSISEGSNSSSSSKEGTSALHDDVHSAVWHRHDAADGDPLGVAAANTDTAATRDNSQHQQQQRRQVIQDDVWDGIPAGKFDDEQLLHHYQPPPPSQYKVKVNYDEQYADEGLGDNDYTTSDLYIAEQPSIVTCKKCHKPVSDKDKLIVDTSVYHKHCFRWDDEEDENVIGDRPPVDAAVENEHLIRWDDVGTAAAAPAQHQRSSSTSADSETKRHTASYEFMPQVQQQVNTGLQSYVDSRGQDQGQGQNEMRQRSEAAISMVSTSSTIQLQSRAEQRMAPDDSDTQLTLASNVTESQSSAYEDEDDGYNYGRSDSRENGGRRQQDGGYPRIELGEGGISENEPVVRDDVVREADQSRDPPPPSKMARNMADKFETMTTSFRHIESQRQPLPAKKGFKWSVRESGLKKSTAADLQTSSNNKVSPASNWDDGSEFGDKRHLSTGTSREADPNDLDPVVTSSMGEMRTAELPPANLTRSLLSKFQSQTSETRHLPPPSPARTQQQLRVARNGPVSRGTSLTSSASSFGVNSSISGGSDVETAALYLESEDDIQERNLYFDEDANPAPSSSYRSQKQQQQQQQEVVSDIPEQGTTRNLLAKFQSMQTSTRKKY